MSSPLEKPQGLNWDAAAVELPPMPMISPGADAMSMTIAGVLPTLTAPLMASVAALSAKENMFSGKLGAAESAYQNADDSGSQSVGQLSSMLGQVGQMAQKAGGAGGGAGGASGIFGSMMEQAMKAAQGSGSQGGGSQGGGGTPAGGSQGGAGAAASAQPSSGQGPAGAAPPQATPRDDAAGAEQGDREARPDERQHERPPADATASPGDSRPSAGPPPVAQPEQPRHGGDDDLARRM